jgi:CheY-like chemotaxis protein/HPt (histidine-containing phosphotransfer) domain-containing protein
MLQHWGLEHDMAEDGQTALDLLEAAEKRNAPYAGILLDYRMPGMNGIELTRRIRADKSRSQPVVIMLSSVDSAELLKEAEGLNIDCRLIKPVHMGDLARALRDIAGKNVEGTGHGKTRRVRRYRGRVLLVEDNAINRKIAELMLTKAGLEVDEAHTGSEAVDKVCGEDYDLVLMDVQMPEMDGYEATRLLREKGHTAVPIVAMTAYAMPEDRKRALDAGMNTFLAKPIDRASFIEVLDSYLMPAEEESEPALRPQALFDRSRLVDRLDGDRALAEEMVELFVSTTTRELKELSHAMGENDFVKAGRLAHSLKGASANMECAALAACAAELEKACRAEDSTNSTAGLGKLRAEFSKVCRQFEAAS